MKRVNLFMLFMILFSSLTFSQVYVDNQGNVHGMDNNKKTQKKEKKQQKSKSSHSFKPSQLEFGGGLGLQFGRYTMVNISPQVGYRLNNWSSVGAGINYSYYKNDNRYDDFKSHYLGMNVYGRVYPFKYFVLSVQPEVSRMWETVKYNGRSHKREEFVPSVLVGGGIRIGGMMAQIQYDVVQDYDSPYGNRVFYSVGYTFSF